MRVLSYNIHKGFSLFNTRFILKSIRDNIREVAPDLIFLQEVLGNHDGHARRIKGWPQESQLEDQGDLELRVVVPAESEVRALHRAAEEGGAVIGVDRFEGQAATTHRLSITMGLEAA
jgi:endonuclease/exonuclease/phosphatase family metal-dependent hydrolase